MNMTLQKENASLHALNTALHEKHHTMSLKVRPACPPHSQVIKWAKTLAPW